MKILIAADTYYPHVNSASYFAQRLAVHLHCRGAEEKHLKQLAGVFGIDDHVPFTGFIPDEDLPGLYSMADCFIIAGTAELLRYHTAPTNFIHRWVYF